MNSYPTELTHHVYASMFVAGLVKPGGATASTSTSPPGSAAVAGPSSEQQQAAPSSDSPSNPLITHPRERYPDLCGQLAELLSARGRNTVWDPARGRSAVFHSILVDHNIRLPPRKTRSSSKSVAPDTDTAAEALAALPSRSPLSPLHPSSPLFPDGLIAPIWIRKHRDLVPAVFVAFHCLAPPYVVDEQADQESEAIHVNGDSAPDGSKARRSLTGAELKARDEELVRLIADRKRSLAERGIKLTVVLLTDREMLESPQLEARLSFIRRSSGLDSRASLFVLTPIPRTELGDFVTSLQGALYDHALDYYREAARRVRRKRTRYPPPPSVVQPVLQAVAASRPGTKVQDLVPLSREGWHLRAEFKLAMFAEWHGDYEMALSHYREAYDLLAGSRGMLGSTMLLPPRTKRWAEAKALSDALSIRIARLHLYADDGRAALSQFRSHLARFAELSSGWGIGDATFEFWGWLAKQYRLMGDLLLEAVKDIPGAPLHPFQIPAHVSQLPAFLLHPHIADNAHNYPSLKAAPGALLPPNNAAMASGIAPGSQLQGPGAFYYLAALCALERRQRFDAMKALDEKGELAQSGATALVHEKKIDHCANIVEAFSRAHDVFSANNHWRMASFIAVKIASTYAHDGQHAAALRFLQRTIKAYVEEGWTDVLQSLVMLAIDCAEQSQDPKAMAVLLLEAIALGDQISAADRLTLKSKWSELSSRSASPSQGDESNVQVPFAADRGPLLADVVFKDPSIPLGADTAVQVTIRSASLSDDSPEVSYEEMTWFDAGDRQVASIRHVSAETDGGKPLIQLGALGEEHSGTADLQWSGAVSKTFCGSVKARDRKPITISRIVLTATLGGLPLSLTLHVKPVPAKSVASAPMWRRDSHKIPWVQLQPREDPTRVEVTRPLHKVDLTIEHHEAAFVDEAVTFVVKVQNNEAFDLRGAVDVVLQQAFPGSQDELAADGMRQPTLSGRLTGVDVGAIPAGGQAEARFTLKCKHRPRPRALRVSMRTSATSADGAVDDESAGEVHKDLSLPVTRAFRAEYSAFWKSGIGSSDGQLQQGNDHGEHLSANTAAAFEDVAPRSPSGGKSSPWPDPQDPSTSSAVAIAHLHAAFAVLTVGVTLRIHQVQVEIDDEFAQDARILPASSEDESLRGDSLQGDWSEKDRWSHTWQVEVALKDYAANVPENEQQASKRPHGPTGYLAIHWSRSQSDSTSNITRLPLPVLSPPHLNARVLVASPPVTYVHQPFTLVFVVVNPSSTPVDVIVYLDDDPSWSISHRTLSIPGIPARGSRSVPTRLVPRAEGTCTLPRARAFHQRSREEIEASGGVSVVNETQYGLPLHVRFRASAGASLGAAASRALAAGQISAEQEGPTLSVLVLNRDDGQ